MYHFKTPIVEKECEVKGLGTIYSSSYTSIDNNFNNVSNAVLAKADELISFRDLGLARIVCGIDHPISRNSSFVNQRALFVPDKKINTYWLNLSVDEQKQFAEHLELANGGEPFLKSTFDAEHYLNLGNKCFPVDNFRKVDVNNFTKDERMMWIFEDMAESVKEYLLRNDIKYLSVNMKDTHYVRIQPKPFSTTLCFLGAGSKYAISSGGDYTGVRTIRGLKRSPVDKIVEHTVSNPSNTYGSEIDYGYSF